MKRKNPGIIARESARNLVSDGSRTVTRKRLINSLNKLHFTDGGITLNFRHRGNSQRISFPAKPQPCLDSTLECTWTEEAGPVADLGPYEFENFFISDGLRNIIVEADLLEAESDRIRFVLPETGYDVSTREVRRHRCSGVGARVTSGSRFVMGELASFSAKSFSVRVAPEGEGGLLPERGDQVDVFLSREGHGIYSGKCEVALCERSKKGLVIALRPLSRTVLRHEPRKFRSLRPHIAPLPEIVFIHPFTGKKVALKVLDISGAGFSVEEHVSQAVLLAGMNIPEVRIEFMAHASITCRAQVIYSDRTPAGTVRSGLAIVDMDVNDHSRLSSLLHQGTFRNSQICTSTFDVEELWEFFFESGFIYPEKYKFIRSQKEHFRRLYLELYGSSPRIARHVIYRDKGLILGHVSMLRYYRKTWLLQHHAAISSSLHRAGLVVMNHILHFINEFHLVFPDLMKYIGCYFRPNNRFAGRVFGGSVKAMADPGKCSVDSFAYLHFSRESSPRPLPVRWVLEKAGKEELQALRESYDGNSGGLLLRSLDLTEDAAALEPMISGEYQRLGFRRQRHLYGLKRKDSVRAVLAVNISDVGLNMSDLTNCVQAFVTDPEGLPPEVLQRALEQLASHYGNNTVPALIHPLSYADERSVRYGKRYDLALLDLEHFGFYLDFIKSLTSRESKRKEE